MRDRLRAVECPKEIIDHIGGWSSSDVGERYGDGFQLSNVKTGLINYVYQLVKLFNHKYEWLSSYV